MDKLSRLAEKYSVNHIGIERLIPIGSGKGLVSDVLSPEEFKFLYDKIINMREQGVKIYLNEPINGLESEAVGGCSAANIACAITTKGEILPCTKLRINAGNIFNKSLKEIWVNSSVLKTIRNRENLIGKCGSCNHKISCGGCRALAYSTMNNYMHQDSYCWVKEV